MLTNLGDFDIFGATFIWTCYFFVRFYKRSILYALLCTFILILGPALLELYFRVYVNLTFPLSNSFVRQIYIA